MGVPISFLVEVLKDIEVELRITNCNNNSKALRLNHVIILLHFVVRRSIGLSKNSV
jgi:hypothetical protein